MNLAGEGMSTGQENPVAIQEDGKGESKSDYEPFVF